MAISYVNDIADALQEKFDTMYDAEEYDVWVDTEGDRHIILQTRTCELDTLVNYDGETIHFTNIDITFNPPKIETMYDIAYSIKLFYEVLEEFDGAELDVEKYM